MHPNQKELTKILSLLSTHYSQEIESLVVHKSKLLSSRGQGLLIILKESVAAISFLKTIQNKEIQKYFKQEIPLVFELNELKNSTDIFPIEFYEILDDHLLILGTPLYELLLIKNTNLRLQIESDLRRNLINIRKAYIRQEKNLFNTLIASFALLISSSKNILRLNKIDPSGLSGRDIIVKLTELVDIKVEPFFDLLRISDANSAPQELNSLFVSYHNELQNIIAMVDLMDIQEEDSSPKPSKNAKK